jgi:RNA-directed DNA polymerase
LAQGQDRHRQGNIDMHVENDGRRLEYFGLPHVVDINSIARLTHLSEGLIFRLVMYPDRYYRKYPIKKKSGGARIISQPSREMKALQAWILRNILDRLAVSPACKGFEISKSQADNARPHIGANYLATLDIENFFPSVSVGRVYHIFHRLGYSKQAAAILAAICTTVESLPQGAPTSPKLANLACWQLDKRLLGYVGKRGITYTRYADDLSFSAFSYKPVTDSLGFIRSIIRSEGFQINDAKTRFSGPSRRRSVTGLVLHGDGFGVKREDYRRIRANLYIACAFGPDNVEGGERHIEGWLAYIHGVDKTRSEKLFNYVRKLEERFPESIATNLFFWYERLGYTAT